MIKKFCAKRIIKFTLDGKVNVMIKYKYAQVDHKIGLRKISCYYDPETGRFITIDDMLTTGIENDWYISGCFRSGQQCN